MTRTPFSSPINKQKRNKLMQEACENASKAEGESPVIFMGRTGVGKSTTINWLYGCAMQVVEEGAAVLFTVDPDKSIVKTGNDITSTTLYPQIIKMSKLAIADTAGFGENRGPEESMCAEYGLQEVIKKSKSIRSIIVFIEFNSFFSKAEKLKQTASDFYELLNDPKNLTAREKNAISFVITKVPSHLDPVRLQKQIELVKSKFEKSLNTLEGSPVQQEETQKQLQILSLINENNLLIIREDGTGFELHSKRLLTADANREFFLNYLAKQAEDSLTKDTFMLLNPLGKLYQELLRRRAVDKLESLSEINHDELCPNFILNANDSINSDQQKQNQDIHHRLRDMQLSIKNEARYYLELMFSPTSDSKTSELSKHYNSLIHLLKSSPLVISETILVHFIKTITLLSELKFVITVCFNNNTLSSEISVMLKSLTEMRAVFHFQLSCQSITHLEGNKKSSVAAIDKANKNVADLEALLDKMSVDYDKSKISDDDYEIELKNQIAERKQGITNLGARPKAVEPPGAAPGGPGARPTPPPYPDPGPRPVPKSNPPDRNDYLVNKWWCDTLHGLEWEPYKVKLAAYDSAMAAYDAALRAWIITNTNYQASLIEIRDYDLNLKEANHLLKKAEKKLSLHKKSSADKLAEVSAHKEATKKELALVKSLRLLLIAAEKTLNSVISSPQRENAIHLYKSIIIKLQLFEKALPEKYFPANLMEQLQKTLSMLEKEQNAVAHLYKSETKVHDKETHITFSSEKPFSDQCSSLKSDTQSLSLNYSCTDDTEFAAFCQGIRACRELHTLDLKNAGLNAAQFSQLLAVMTNLKDLHELNLDHNLLNPQSALALLALIYVHPSLVVVNLESNRSIPSVINEIIQGILTFKQQLKVSGSAISEQKLDDFLSDYLKCKELLSLSMSDARQFTVKVSINSNAKNNYKLEHVSTSASLQFDQYLLDFQALRSDLQLDQGSNSTQKSGQFGSFSYKKDSSSIFSKSKSDADNSFKRKDEEAETHSMDSLF